MQNEENEEPVSAAISVLMEAFAKSDLPKENKHQHERVAVDWSVCARSWRYPSSAHPAVVGQAHRGAKL